jgi:hypothetical protein
MLRKGDGERENSQSQWGKLWGEIEGGIEGRVEE